MSNIKIIGGDLVKAFKAGDVEVMAHACNCFHTTGAGIAKKIAEVYPEALAADKETFVGDKDKLGGFSKVKLANGQYIFNLYTQYKYGRNKRYTSYDAAAEAFTRMEEFAATFGIRKIGIPYKMGCMNGGGEWSVVLPIIEAAWKESEITTLYIYEGD